MNSPPKPLGPKWVLPSFVWLALASCQAMGPPNKPPVEPHEAGDAGLVVTYKKLQWNETTWRHGGLVENRSGEPVTYLAKGPDSPTWWHELWTDAGWIRERLDVFCGVGWGPRQLEAGDVLLCRGLLHSPNDTYYMPPVEGVAQERAHYLGWSRSGIRVLDAETGEYEFTWSQAYPMAIVVRDPDPDPFERVRTYRAAREEAEAQFEVPAGGTK